MRILFPLRTTRLTALTLALAAGAPAQQAHGGIDAERRTTTCFVADAQGLTLAGVAIGYTEAPWRDDYEATIQQLRASNYTRLGKGWWTTLETVGALEIGGTKVKPGSYYLGLAVADDGAFSLLLFDSKRAMQARLLSATTALYTGEAKPELRAPMTLAKGASARAVSPLTFALAADAKNPSRGTLAIRWGKHELSAPVVFDLTPPKSANAAQEPILEDHMKAMNEAFPKVLAFARGEGEAPLQDVAAMIEHATAARLLVPEMAADVAEAERPKFERTYRQAMRVTVRALLDLEDALDAGDAAKAKERIGTLGKEKADNHKKFIKD